MGISRGGYKVEVGDMTVLPLKGTFPYKWKLCILCTDLKIKTKMSILLFFEPDVEANCFDFHLASQYGCQRM